MLEWLSRVESTPEPPKVTNFLIVPEMTPLRAAHDARNVSKLTVNPIHRPKNRAYVAQFNDGAFIARSKVPILLGTANISLNWRLVSHDSASGIISKSSRT